MPTDSISAGDRSCAGVCAAGSRRSSATPPRATRFLEQLRFELGFEDRICSILVDQIGGLSIRDRDEVSSVHISPGWAVVASEVRTESEC